VRYIWSGFVIRKRAKASTCSRSFLLFHLNAQYALVDQLDLLDQGNAEGEPRTGLAENFAFTVGVYDPVDLTIAADNRLLRFRNDRDRHA
jgi:hypothetical protein